MKLKQYKDKYYRWNAQLSPTTRKGISISADFLIGAFKIPYEAITGKDFSSGETISNRQRSWKGVAATATGIHFGTLGYGFSNGYSIELAKLLIAANAIHRSSYGLSLLEIEKLPYHTKQYTIATSLLLATTFGTLSSKDQIKFNKNQQIQQYIGRKQTL